MRKALLLAAYQIIVQDRVENALVVSETVTEVKQKEGEPPARFANAVLRKVADESKKWKNLPILEQKTPTMKASTASLPLWLWKRFVKQYGESWAEAVAGASLERPILWVRVRSGVEDFEKNFASAMTGPIPGSYCIHAVGRVTELKGFREGQFFVQDVSSQVLVAEATAEVRKRWPEARTVLDLCASPGGKTAGLVWNGFQVSATDRIPERIRLLQETVDRLCPGEVCILPSSEEVSSLPLQDWVWVDAPCSGSGILRRHPDVRWLRREGELESLYKTQSALVRKAWTQVRPGGFLMYSVCSLLKEEGEWLFEKLSLPGQPLRSWCLAPHFAPHGDGFWAVLILKT